MSTIGAIRLVVAMTVVSGCGADAVWVGEVSDNMCLTSHLFDEHRAPETAGDCTRRCVKSGAKFVLLTNGRVYAIENQNHPSLLEHAGDTVRVTGRMQGEAIRIARIEAPVTP